MHAPQSTDERDPIPLRPLCSRVDTYNHTRSTGPTYGAQEPLQEDSRVPVRSSPTDVPTTVTKYCMFSFELYKYCIYVFRFCIAYRLLLPFCIDDVHVTFFLPLCLFYSFSTVLGVLQHVRVHLSASRWSPLVHVNFA